LADLPLLLTNPVSNFISNLINHVLSAKQAVGGGGNVVGTKFAEDLLLAKPDATKSKRPFKLPRGVCLT
jgi:hypothetical protein